MSNDHKRTTITLKQRKICTKNYTRKRCPPNQFFIKLITKSNKNLRLQFFQVTTFLNQMTPIIVILWKTTKTYKKGCKFAKITKIGFMKTCCSKKKEHLRKIKPLWRANCISKHNWCELYVEILIYNLTEIKLADLKNLFFY